MLSSIQSLRAIAAYMVVFVHLSVLLQPLGLERVAIRGSVGVDIFFVISGFIMLRTATGPGRDAPLPFLKHRIARIVPSYWFLTLLVFVIATEVPRMFGGTQASLPHLLKSLAFIPYQRMDGTVRPLLFVGWSLNYEMLFYLLFTAALAMRAMWQKLSLAVTVGALVTALVVVGALLHSRMLVLAFFSAPIMLEFVLGVILARAYDHFTDSPRIAPAAWAALILATGVLLCSNELAQAFGTYFGRIPYTGVSAMIIVAAALQLEKIGHWPQIGWLGKMGDASYALYLTHPFTTVSLTAVVGKLGLISAGLAPILILVAFALSSLVAYLYYLLIETPLSRAVRNCLSPSR